MTDWKIRMHPAFFADLDNLSKSELEAFAKKKRKIKQQPLRLKHLRGGENCYRERITDGIRLVYYVQGTTIWFLTIDKHDDAYDTYKDRLQSL